MLAIAVWLRAPPIAWWSWGMASHDSSWQWHPLHSTTVLLCEPHPSPSLILERLTAEERTCGVRAIDLRSGQVVALLRFETAVQKVFAVTVLP